MSKLSRTPPLRTVHFNKINQVLTHVNEPMLPRKEKKKVRQELHLIKQLGQLELLLEKINRLELWKVKGGLKTTDSILKKLYEETLTIQIDITQQPQNNVLLARIKSEKSLYPKAIKLLFNEKDRNTPQSATRDDQYQLNHLDQLYVTACRLYHDLNLSDHKYITYQLALLYQCINRQGVPFISYKSRIEQRFEEIKSATKKSIVIHLDANQISWLQSLTLDIIMQVTDHTSIMKCGQTFSIMRQMTTTAAVTN